MKHLKSWKIFENSFSSLDEYQNEILGFLKKYNLFPEQIRYLLDQYSEEIEEWYNEGKYSKDFAEKIASDLNPSRSTRSIETECLRARAAYRLAPLSQTRRARTRSTSDAGGLDTRDISM